MKKLFVLFILSLAIVSLTTGNPIDSAIAKKAGQTFITTVMNSKNAISNSSLDLVYTDASYATSNKDVITQTNYFYVFNLNQTQGFVIISADDRVLPVLGYSDEKGFDPDHIPEQVAEWLEGYRSQIKSILTNNLPGTNKITKNWTDLIQGNTSQLAGKRGSLSPLIQTKWSQRPYYNALCPYDTHYKQLAVTGCTATAMAQVMKYWNYPAKGSGFHSYYNYYSTLSANFGSTTYQWSSMPNSVSTNNNAVATLMYHCGVSVNMNYGVNGSGGAFISSTSPCAESALKIYFGYKNTLQGVLRSSYSDAQWLIMLKTELDSGRPVLYVGYDHAAAVGHAFVCDGYDNNDYCHFNWGWSGNYDGYFAINSLNPKTYNFDSTQQAIIGIQPKIATSTQKYNLRLDTNVTPSDTSITYGQSFSVSTNISNDGNNTFTGDYYAAIYNDNFDLVGFMDSIMNITLQGGFHDTTDLVFSTTGKLAMLPGTYYVCILYRPIGGYLTFVSNGLYNNIAKIVVTYSNSIELFSAMLVTPDTTLTQGDSASVNLNVFNSGIFAFYGQYRVSLFNLSGNLVQTIGTIIDSTGLTPNNSYSAPYLTFNTTSITAEPGTYLLALQYYPASSGNWYLAGSTYFPNPIKVIVQLPPPPPLKPDIYEPDNWVAQAYELPVSFTNETDSINTQGSNCHSVSDFDYYKIILDTGYHYSISVRLQDVNNGNNGNNYTLEAMLSYSTDGKIFSGKFYNVTPGDIQINGGGIVYFLITPYCFGETGTYLLDLNITKSALQSSAKEITGFTVSGIVGSAIIDSAYAAVSLQVSSSTDLTSIAPCITVSKYASIKPDSGVAQDFIYPVLYTVTAQEGTYKVWIVTITKQNSIIKEWNPPESELTLFPNPSSYNLSISFYNSELSNITISIFNSLGIEIKQFDKKDVFGQSTVNFSTESLLTGVYYCFMNNGTNKILKRFLVVR